MSSEVTLTEARNSLGELVARVQYGGETVYLTRRGRRTAALVSVAAAELLEHLEDLLDAQAVSRVQQRLAAGLEGRRRLVSAEPDQDRTIPDDMAARYHVDVTATADTELTRIRRGQRRDVDRLERAMLSLGADPRPADGTSIRSLSGVGRIRVGDYRICYTVDHAVLTVLVLLIHTRKDLPAQLTRLLGK